MYQLTSSLTTILRTSDGASIPTDPANSDYQKYVEWENAGGVAVPYIPSIPTIADKLTQLDIENTLTQRNLREFILLTAKAVQQLNPGLDLTQIPGVAKVVAVEMAASVLRSQL